MDIKRSALQPDSHRHPAGSAKMEMKADLNGIRFQNGQSADCDQAKHNSSDRVWRRCCGLALILSVLSMVWCTVTWFENVSIQQRLHSVETQLTDRHLELRLEYLLQNKLNQDGAAHIRTVRQVSSSPGECVCPPGKPQIVSVGFWRPPHVVLHVYWCEFVCQHFLGWAHLVIKLLTLTLMTDSTSFSGHFLFIFRGGRKVVKGQFFSLTTTIKQKLFNLNLRVSVCGGSVVNFSTWRMLSSVFPHVHDPSGSLCTA